VEDRQSYVSSRVKKYPGGECACCIYDVCAYSCVCVCVCVINADVRASGCRSTKDRSDYPMIRKEISLLRFNSPAFSALELFLNNPPFLIMPLHALASRIASRCKRGGNKSLAISALPTDKTNNS